MGFTGYSFGKQGLTCSGRADKQRSFRKFGTDGCIFCRIVQEIYNLLQRFFGFILSGNIGEEYTGLFLYIGFGFALAHIPHHPAAFAHAAHDQIHTHDQKYERNQET